jgi:hypothetical protein
MNTRQVIQEVARNSHNARYVFGVVRLSILLIITCVASVYCL